MRRWLKAKVISLVVWLLPGVSVADNASDITAGMQAGLWEQTITPSGGQLEAVMEQQYAEQRNAGEESTGVAPGPYGMLQAAVNRRCITEAQIERGFHFPVQPGCHSEVRRTGQYSFSVSTRCSVSETTDLVVFEGDFLLVNKHRYQGVMHFLPPEGSAVPEGRVEVEGRWLSESCNP